MVRVTFRTRWKPRADRCICFIAACRRPCADSSTLQKFQTSTGPISELVIIPADSSLFRCICLDASDLPWICAEVSASEDCTSFSYSTLGTSTKRSIRSSSGPLIRFLYLEIELGLHVHSRSGSL